LDTHIWLWSLLAPGRLPRAVFEALAASDVRLWLSPISVWEAHLLAEKGRIKVDAEPAVWVQRLLDAAPIREAALTRAVALESRRIAVGTNDPADRFIAATAKVHGLTLVTVDQHLLAADLPLLGH
jgi:PIN domain nuclease of toxin-antitoxin system